MTPDASQVRHSSDDRDRDSLMPRYVAFRVLLRDRPLSIHAPSACPAAQTASSHFSFSRNGNLRGPLPFPFPFRLRPSRLSRRRQDVLKSGILLLMDSKHHKKFIRKRRVVKVSEKGFGASRGESGRMGAVLVSLFMQNIQMTMNLFHPVCVCFFFFYQLP